MLATWLAALAFLIPLQCLALVKLADRLALRDRNATVQADGKSGARYA